MGDTFTVNSVTIPEVVKLIARLQKGGADVVALHPDQWQVSGHGITATAKYVPETLILTVEVESKPWYVPMAVIQSKVKAALV